MEPYLPVRAGGTEPSWNMSAICQPDDDGDYSGCEYDFSSFDVDDSGPLPVQKREKTILICQDWAEKNFGSNKEGSGKEAGRFLEVFKECGILKSMPCMDINGDLIPERDRYTCGDDLIMPDKEYESLEGFMNVDQLGVRTKRQNLTACKPLDLRCKCLPALGRGVIFIYFLNSHQARSTTTLALRL